MRSIVACVTSVGPKAVLRLLAHWPRLWSWMSDVTQEHYLEKEGQYFLGEG